MTDETARLLRRIAELKAALDRERRRSYNLRRSRDRGRARATRKGL